MQTIQLTQDDLYLIAYALATTWRVVTDNPDEHKTISEAGNDRLDQLFAQVNEARNTWEAGGTLTQN